MTMIRGWMTMTAMGDDRRTGADDERTKDDDDG